ncbi:MAG: hypothetical protein NTW14_06265 [bacterium]|nr:hypothetical protein [bacterium]
MKTKLYPAITTLILVIFFATAFAAGVITSFEARSEGDYAYLEWTSESESGLSVYRVERSLDALQFISVAEVEPTGDHSSYVYEDHDLVKSSTRTYYYRINALMKDGTNSFSSVKSVTLAFSGIQQTWGSIKALFR